MEHCGTGFTKSEQHVAAGMSRHLIYCICFSRPGTTSAPCHKCPRGTLLMCSLVQTHKVIPGKNRLFSTSTVPYYVAITANCNPLFILKFPSVSNSCLKSKLRPRLYLRGHQDILCINDFLKFNPDYMFSFFVFFFF